MNGLFVLRVAKEASAKPPPAKSGYKVEPGKAEETSFRKVFNNARRDPENADGSADRTEMTPLKEIEIEQANSGLPSGEETLLLPNSLTGQSQDAKQDANQVLSTSDQEKGSIQAIQSIQGQNIIPSSSGSVQTQGAMQILGLLLAEPEQSPVAWIPISEDEQNKQQDTNQSQESLPTQPVQTSVESKLFQVVEQGRAQDVSQNQEKLPLQSGQLPGKDIPILVFEQVKSESLQSKVEVQLPQDNLTPQVIEGGKDEIPIQDLSKSEMEKSSTVQAKPEVVVNQQDIKSDPSNGKIQIATAKVTEASSEAKTPPETLVNPVRNALDKKPSLFTTGEPPPPIHPGNGNQQIAGSQTIEPARMAEAQHPQLVEQVSRGIDTLSKAGQQSIRLQLYPENLGKIDLRLTSGTDGVRIVINADSPATSLLMERYLPELRQVLIQSGVNLAGLSVGSGNTRGNTGNSERWQPASWGTHKNPVAIAEIDDLESRENRVVVSASSIDYYI